MHPNLGKTFAALALTAFVAAALVPIVAAEGDGGHRSAGPSDERRDDAREHREDAMAKREKAREHLEKARHHAAPLNLTLSLNGTATDKDGANYTIQISGLLASKPKFKDENLTGAKSKDVVSIRILNESGAVVREGNVTVKLQVHKTVDGWEWSLEGGKKWFWEKPKIRLHGNGTLDADNLTLSLGGSGKILVKFDGEHRAQPLRATVEGALVRS